MAKSVRQRGFEVRPETLRSFRRNRGWTQEAAAYQAGISEKLIRKAESGGRIDAKSLAALSILYSTADAPVSAQDLLAADHSLEASHSRPSCLLEDWLNGIWNDRWLETVDLLAAEPLEFHCELGCLTSRSALRARCARVRESFTDFQITIEALAHSGDQCSCRWRLAMTHSGPWRGRPPMHRRLVAQGSTSVRHQGGRIVEGWEHWDPRLAFQQLAERGDSKAES